jgi:hypothetical protein
VSRTFNFGERLRFSRGLREKSDLEAIKTLIPGCTKVVKTGERIDRTGIDYEAFLAGGAVLFVDGKARDKGCSRYWWDGDPQLALETWSVRPGGKYQTCCNRAKIGWTLNEKSNVDYVYFSFDPIDTNACFVIAFQLLRTAFTMHRDTWAAKYKPRTNDNEQDGQRWESEWIPVPVREIRDAIDFVCEGRLADRQRHFAFP